MQLDLFGATDTSANRDAAPPVLMSGGWAPPEALAFDAALHRGSLGDAIAILNRLKVNVVKQVLLASGFTLGVTDSRASLIASVQSDILAAARLRLNGFGLRAAKLHEENKSALIDYNDNHSAILDSKEVANDVGRTLQAGVLSEGRGIEDRDSGVNRGVGGQSVDVGLAGTGGTAASVGDLSGLPGNASGSGEGHSGERGEYEAPVEAGNIADVRSGGIAADDVVADYVLTDEDRIGLGGLAEKFQDNLRAIRIVKALAVERRNAVDDERRELVRYVGWGGIKGVFDPDNKQWARQHVALRSLLSDAEWAAASRSQLDAFYTPPVVVKSMYAAISRLGFQHGVVSENGK